MCSRTLTIIEALGELLAFLHSLLCFETAEPKHNGDPRESRAMETAHSTTATKPEILVYREKGYY